MGRKGPSIRGFRQSAMPIGMLLRPKSCPKFDGHSLDRSGFFTGFLAKLFFFSAGAPNRPILWYNDTRYREVWIVESLSEAPTGAVETPKGEVVFQNMEMDDLNLDKYDNILELEESEYPQFTLAKNKARFLRMVSWYRAKEEWIEVAPLSGVSKLFKRQTKELEGIRANKMDYEMELETGTLTPSQRSYRRDELKMCKVHEKMAVHLISKLQVKIKSGRR